MAYFRQYLPWPLKQRECFLSASGTILKEHNSAVLSMSTVSQDSWLGTPIALNKDFVKLDIHKALIEAKVLSESKCQIKIVMNADPHIDYIP